MRKDLVRFLNRIDTPLMIIGVAIQFVLTTIAYFTNADVGNYLLYNVAPIAWGMVIVGILGEVLRFILDDQPNEESEELL